MQFTRKLECYRKNKAQKKEAEKKGDSTLVRLFNRSPEEYIGVIPCKEGNNPKFERLQKFRSLCNLHFDFIFKANSAEKEKYLLTKGKMKLDVEKIRLETNSTYALLKSVRFLQVTFFARSLVI